MTTRPLVIAVPGSEAHADRLCARLDAELAAIVVRQFPDGEVYVRIDSPVAGRQVVLACGLEHPGDRFFAFTFLAATARELGAARVGLVAPYLSFMRQDSRFHPGEGITSRYFAGLVSSAVDWLVTVDPHLHRWSSLDAIYKIPTRITRAAPAIAAWVTANIERPLLVGPDAESEQWVAAVAERCDAPFLILEKTRRGDRDVSVSAPDVSRWHDRTPVLVDDIISTARTMIATVGHLQQTSLPAPVCVGVHAVFADAAHDELLAAGAARIVTCNTITHASNQICVADALAATTREMLAS